MDPVSWAGSVNLETPAAGLLRQLAAALPPNREFTVTVFGSAPIQITVDSAHPRVEIIAPALAKRRAGYGEPPQDYKQELRDALRSVSKK